jgi:hypothetical protein
MTEQELQQHRDTANSAIGAVTTTAGRLIASLPAQFLCLVVLNTAFLVGLLWFLNEQEKTRERIYGPILNSCMGQVPLPMVQELLRGIGK